MNVMLGIVAILAVGVLGVLLPVFVESYRRLRVPRTVQCPETQEPTVILLNARRGAAGALVGRSMLSVSECTRWSARPWHRNCSQHCLEDICNEAANSE